VTAAALASINLIPVTPSIALGTTQQFTATGIYTDGSTQNLTSTAAWSSDTVSVVTINNAGLAQSIGVGAATITVASGTISGSTLLTVTGAALASIAINPASATVPLGTTQQFTATGTFSDGTTQDLTQSVHWSSTVATVATISNTVGAAGLASTLSAGATTIGATSGSVSAAATLTVNAPALVSIAITPQAPVIVLGATQQFTATGTYTDGSTQDLTALATWSSSVVTVAIISNSAVSNGLATSSGLGTANISAVFNSISSSTTITVGSPALVSIAIAPMSASISVGATQQFAATGTYADGSTQSLTTSVTWTSSVITVATINNSAGSQGIATGVGSGTSTISAAMGSVAASSNLIVLPPALSSFRHVVVIVQENRTPDNLFQGLCSAPFGGGSLCSSNPTASQYDIQTSNWLDKTSSTGTTQPTAVLLGNDYSPSHTHLAFTIMCDLSAAGQCQMDGAADTACTGTCPTRAAFGYVDNSTGTLNPYLTLATQYGWANYMFQTNQGPSFPAHQFLFGGTSAPSAADDAAGTFAANDPTGTISGCIALAGTTVPLVGSSGGVQQIYPCFEHQTMADLFDTAGISWKYYTPSTGSIFTAPNAIQHICQPSAPTGGECLGSDWTNDVVINPVQVLTDISNCNLAGVTWVIPGGQNSDLAGGKQSGGPSWVSSIVNAIGNNPNCGDGESYWNNTAILITWDDWGGWYDHEPPTFLAKPEGDYQYGFRVPFLFVSAYTLPAYVDNDRMDFGSVLRFIEHNFNIEEGSLNFADARSQTDLAGFFNFNLVPRPFQTITAPLTADYFLHNKEPLTDPDTD